MRRKAMKATWKAAKISLGVTLLWASLTIGVQGYIGAGGGLGSGLGKGWVQLRGHVLCAECTLEELRATPPAPRSRLYQLDHRLGQVVMQVAPESASLPYRRLWLKGEDHLFKTLAAEENLFKEIEVSGLLREYLPTSGTLDLAAVKVLHRNTE